MLAQADGIDWNTLLQAPDTFGMMIGMSTLIVIILGVTIAFQWRRVVQARYSTELKASMIERGFTAEEIERVINAGGAHGRVGKKIAHAVDVCRPDHREHARREPVKDPMSC